MKKIDARTYSQEVQEALRRQIVRLRKEGRSNMDVADIVGVSISHASRVWTRYHEVDFLIEELSLRQAALCLMSDAAQGVTLLNWQGAAMP